MATHETATVVPLHQSRPKTAAERAAAYRARKKGKAASPKASPKSPVTAPVTAPVTVTAVTPVTPVSAVTAVTLKRSRDAVTPSRPVAQLLLIGAAFGLTGVGVIMNGWFARSLGSSDVAGWLFLAIGVAADLVALATPSCAARLWAAQQRGAAAIGWAVFSVTFGFALVAGIGFASVNISDVTMARASRVTPATVTARATLADAMAARDRECKGGVGKHCRERELSVIDARKVADAAARTVEQQADPQTEAAMEIVSWLSRGLIAPSGKDFAMLRLLLLALMPQIGGVLLMLGRAK